MRLSRIVVACGALVACACAALVHAADAPTIVFASGEEEYHSAETLPAFAKFVETNYHFKTVFLERKLVPDHFESLDALEHADLVVIFARRMTLPDEQLKKFQKYFESGRPVIGIR